MAEHLAGASVDEPLGPVRGAERLDLRRARARTSTSTSTGVERLATYAATLAPESACTSVQLHLQVAPSDFARTWNAAQVLAGPQLALGANSPYFFGRELWRETRIELFAQSTDTRPAGAAQPGRPAPGVVRRALDHVDLRPVRGERPVLPGAAARGHATRTRWPSSSRAAHPRLQELRLHNGTIYRWNRPVYDVVDGRPHVRVENRVLPAGPTVVDILANAAFYYGALRVLAEDERPVWSKLTFPTAEENFHECARRGLDADRVLAGHRRGHRRRAGAAPAAADGARGPAALGRRRRRPGPVPRRHRAAGEDRPQRRGLAGRDRARAGGARAATGRRRCRRCSRSTCEGMHSNEPVHTWPVP